MMRPSFVPVAALIAVAPAIGQASASRSPTTKEAKQAAIVTEQSRGIVTTRVGVPVEIRLQAQAGTGFSWVPTRGAAELSEMKPLRGSRAVPGGMQTERFRFLAKRRGNYRLVFSYDQPWSDGTKGARTKTFIIAVR